MSTAFTFFIYFIFIWHGNSFIDCSDIHFFSLISFHLYTWISFYIPKQITSICLFFLVRQLEIYFILINFIIKPCINWISLFEFDTLLKGKPYTQYKVDLRNISFIFLAVFPVLSHYLFYYNGILSADSDSIVLKFLILCLVEFLNSH